MMVDKTGYVMVDKTSVSVMVMVDKTGCASVMVDKTGCISVMVDKDWMCRCDGG